MDALARGPIGPSKKMGADGEAPEDPWGKKEK